MMSTIRLILTTAVIAGFLGAGLLASAAPAAARTDSPVLVAASQPNQQGGQQQGNGSNIDPISGKAVKNTSVVEYINSAYNWAAIIGGLLAVMMIMYAGFTYMTSAGDPEKSSNAKDMIEKALIGLGLLIMAAVILKTINPRTVQPCNPNQANCGDIDFSKVNGGQPGQNK